MLEGGLVRVDGVDEVVFDCVELFAAEVALQEDRLGRR